MRRRPPRARRRRRARPAGRASRRRSFPFRLPLEVGPQPVKPPLPAPPGLDPLHRIVQMPGIEPTLTDTALLLGGDELRLFENPDVLEQAGHGHASGPGQLTDTGGPP